MYTVKRFSAAQWTQAAQQIAHNDIQHGPWESLERADMTCAPWGGPEVPACAWVGWDAEELYLFFQARETPILTKETQRNGAVYRDSCVECFFAPPGMDAYCNMEINAAGVYHLAWGVGRHGRVFPETTPDVRTGQAGEWWMACARLPAALWQGVLQPGDQLRGNFQKCCEDKQPPHYMTWQPIGTPTPDFHRPEWFGAWVLEA